MESPPKRIRALARLASGVAWLLVACSAVAAADATPWRIDPGRSTIGFELSAMGIVPIRGTFARFAGELARDPDEGPLRVSMRIDATSLTMGSERYRDWARSREFFDVRRHPEIAFVSGAITDALLTRGGELVGVLRIRGIERKVTFMVESGTCSLASDRCELRVSGQINRRQFGMITRRMTLSDRVNLDMRFVAKRSEAPPPASHLDSPQR